MDRIAQMHEGHARSHDGRMTSPHVGTEPEIGELFRRVSADLSTLAHQEFQLAAAELRDSVDEVKKSLVKFAVAAIIAIPGVIAIAAFLVIVLADALGSWSAASLIVGVALLAIAGVLVWRAAAVVADNVGLPETAESLAEDARWGKKELKAFKRELTT